MDVVFYSYNPFLHLVLNRERELAVTFSKDCTYIPKNEIELQLLREYAERTSNSYNIIEADKMDLEELQRKHKELEERLFLEAEERSQQREQKELKRLEQERELRELSESIYR